MHTLSSDTGHERISVREASGLSYIYIDYSGLSPEEMIVLLDKVIDYSVRHKPPFIADFNNTKVNTSYLKKSNEWINKTKNIIPFGAFIGLDFTRAFLLESYLSINGMKHRHFDSYKEAEYALMFHYKTIN